MTRHRARLARRTRISLAASFLGVIGLVALGVTGFASAATPAAPPFHQCPSIGQSPTCQILIQVNQDQSVTVLGDPAVGPYDGSDDTLVGVQNNSGKDVAAITVTGAGTGLGGLDGDGLCTMNVSGCPFGPTGYEGPGTAIKTDPNQLDSAEIDFSGLRNGGSTYFSLEGALTSAALTARQGTLGGGAGNPKTYVALGDSYSSGEGNPGSNGKFDLNQACHRTSNAWPSLLAKADARVKLAQNLACSGATGSDLTRTYRGQPSQLQAMQKYTPQVVTVTVGGNDIGFKPVLEYCYYSTAVLHLPQQLCLNALHNEESYIDARSFSWSGFYNQIKAEAPGAAINVVGYPRIFPATQQSTHNCGWLSDAMRKELNVLSDKLDGSLKNAANGVGVNYIDTSDVLAGHELCTQQSWVNPITLRGDLSYDAHPNGAGQQAIATRVADRLRTA